SFGSIFGGLDDNAVISFKLQGKKIPVRELLAGRPDITAGIRFRTPEGVLAESVQVPLQYKDGNLTGRLAFDIPWRFMPEFLDGDIEGKLTLNMDNKLLHKKYFLKDPGTVSRLIEFDIPVSASLLSYILILLLILVPCTLAAYFTFFKKRTKAMSKDVPILIYRDGNKFEPDPTVKKELEIFKRKLVLNKKVKTPFSIPGIPDQWEPLLTVTRHTVKKGVKVSVGYEKYKFSKKDKDRFHEIQLETRDDDDRDRHTIKGLEPYDMVFELKIKDESPT
ncbi:MAG: hypothetical protein GY757_42370, partial [bacterium]|nr:hypothetical protein [bacterium]